MQVRDIGAFVLLAAMWGASFLFIKIGAPVLGPTVLAESRVAIGVLGLLIYALIVGFHLDFKKYWKQFLLLGLLNSVIPFVLIIGAELTITSSLAAILNATTPLFTAVIASIWGKETMTAKKIIGLTLGLCGVIVVVGGGTLSFSVGFLLAVGSSLLASCFYGISTVYNKAVFQGVPALTITIGQLGGASLLLLPMSAVNLPSEIPSLGVIAAVVSLALFCTAFANVLYYNLIARAGATIATSVTFLVPVFGIVWGKVFLNEQIDYNLIIGFLIILGGLMLISNLKLPFAKV